MDSFKRIVIKNSALEFLHDLELNLDLVQLLRLEMQLDGLMTQFLQNIVEHDLFLRVEGWYLKRHDLTGHELLIFLFIHLISERDQCTTLTRTIIMGQIQ